MAPGTFWATDVSNASYLSALGRQMPVRQVSSLFRSAALTSDDLSFLRTHSVRYILADLRLTKGLPASGSYFAADDMAFRYTVPLSGGQLTKFAALPGVSVVYDSGDIRIFEVEAAIHAG